MNNLFISISKVLHKPQKSKQQTLPKIKQVRILKKVRNSWKSSAWGQSLSPVISKIGNQIMFILKRKYTAISILLTTQAFPRSSVYPPQQPRISLVDQHNLGKLRLLLHERLILLCKRGIELLHPCERIIMQQLGLNIGLNGHFAAAHARIRFKYHTSIYSTLIDEDSHEQHATNAGAAPSPWYGGLPGEGGIQLAEAQRLYRRVV